MRSGMLDSAAMVSRQSRRSQLLDYVTNGHAGNEVPTVSYWLMKSEPDTYGIDDLARDKRTRWDGIRNYQARNMIRDDMRPGDRAFFYHSSCEVPAVVGVMKIASDAYPDPTQFDRKSKYYDPKSTKDRPRWFVVDVEFESKLARPVTLAEVREKKSLGDFRLIKRGNRLSVFPVSAKHWNIVQKLAGG
jgi:predicted RNA-binding protein with PUA-like domain